MSEVIRKIKLAELECQLNEIQFEIKRTEGIINSVNIKSESFRKKSKKRLLELIKKRTRLTDTITEAMFLDMELE